MKKISLIQELSSVLSPTVLDNLVRKIGLPREILENVVNHTRPGILAALLSKCSDASGLHQTYAAMMSPHSDARLGEKIPDLSSTTSGIKALEKSGEFLFVSATALELAALSDFVAMRAGVPAQAAYVVAAIISASLGAVIKHNLLLEQGSAADVARWLLQEWGSVEPFLTELLALSVQSDESVCPLALWLKTEDTNALREAVQRQSETLYDHPSHAEAKTEASISWRDERISNWKSKVRNQRIVVLGVLLLLLLVVVLTFGWRAGWMDRAESHLSHTISRNVAPAPASGPAEEIQQSGKENVGGAAGVTSPAKLDPGVPAARRTENGNLPSTNVPSGKASILRIGVNKWGIPNIVATVSSEDEKERLLLSLKNIEQENTFDANILVERDTSAANWLAILPELKPVLTSPETDIVIQGRSIEIGGEKAKKDELILYLRGRLADNYDVRSFDPVKEQKEATSLFRAVAEKQIKNLECEAIESVINLQIIGFAKNSTHFGEDVADNLKRAAGLINRCIELKFIKHISVDAYSDGRGDAKRNLQLSKKRAEAVRRALINGGVPAHLIEAVGHGADNEKMSDLTERGRFFNRRISFTLQ